MVRQRATALAPVAAVVLLAACEHPITRPALAPVPSAQTTAAADAVGAPGVDVQRASAVLAARMPKGWDRPEAYGSRRVRARAASVADAAAFAALVTPENLPAVARALDQLLRATTPGQPVPR